VSRGLLPLALAVLLLAAPAWGQQRSEDEAGDVAEADKDAAGPLRERIRPVSGHLFLMDGRFELSPMVGLSVRDAFFTKVLLGAALTYHFNEDWALSARGGYTASLISGSAQICSPSASLSGQLAGCRAPTWEELTRLGGQPANRAYGLLTFVTSLDVLWSPLYGKLALFAERVLSFNMYLLAGPSLVMYGPLNVLAPGGNVGLGFRFVVNDFLAIRLELRDVIYAEEGSEAGAATATSTSVRNQLMAELGLSIFLPTSFQER
jgi:outer membrane beta-barrel protein